MNRKGPAADIIYYNGKILTVDAGFTIAEAVAVSGDKFSAVGSNEAVLSIALKDTQLVNLKGRTVIPGLNDSHLHPTMASLSELNGEIPDIHSKDELLFWIKREADIKVNGEWIVHPKLFITRTRGMRYPSIDELDEAAPGNPVFLNGTYSGMVNTFALKISGLLKENLNPGILTDPVSLKPTGIIRPDIFPLLAYKNDDEIDEETYLSALETMLGRYNAVGITSVTDGWVKPADKNRYLQLERENRLTARVNLCLTPDFLNQENDAGKVISGIEDASFQGDEFLRISAVKVFLDGGILTGTAGIKKPWGEKCQQIFGFDGTDYYGHLNYTQEKVSEIAVAAVKSGWKFTAHCIGDRALEILLTAFEEADSIKKIRDLRWSVIHGNFFDSETIARASKSGVIIECQIAWFYKDASYIEYILGEEYLDMFLPLRSMLDAGVKLAGGSDHMAKFNPVTSINPYHTFLSIQTMVTREVEDGRVINKNEAISREHALRLYTINGAYSTGEENIKGSIEPGKLADMVILDTDYLVCDEKNIKDIKALATIVGGKVVYQADEE